jgi:hypothetical protein
LKSKGHLAITQRPAGEFDGGQGKVVRFGAIFFQRVLKRLETVMDMSRVHNIAQRLVDAHGMKAELEVARKLKEAEASGIKSEIELWQRVRLTVREMKPAHES